MKKKRVLIKLSQFRRAINHVLRQRGLVKLASPLSAGAQKVWDWYMKLGTGRQVL